MWWQETGLNRDAGLFRAFINCTYTHLYDLVVWFTTPKYA